MASLKSRDPQLPSHPVHHSKVNRTRCKAQTPLGRQHLVMLPGCSEIVCGAPSTWQSALHSRPDPRTRALAPSHHGATVVCP